MLFPRMESYQHLVLLVWKDLILKGFSIPEAKILYASLRKFRLAESPKELSQQARINPLVIYSFPDLLLSMFSLRVDPKNLKSSIILLFGPYATNSGPLTFRSIPFETWER